jgi:glycosyltransferase involved in cell wall biosynthesis
MRVTVVISSLKGGGAEKVAMNLANSWVSKGREVTLLTTSQRGARPTLPVDARIVHRDLGWPRASREDELATESVAAVLRGMQHTGSTDLLSQTLLLASLREAILESKPDVVVAHIDVTNIRVIAAMQGTGIPVIACEHTDAERVSLGAWRDARNALYPRAYAVVAPHESIAQWLSKRGAPAVAIANSLAPPPGFGRRRSGARLQLLTLTRLSREKRLDLMLHAFSRVSGEHPMWVLHIYGEGPLRQSLEALAEKLGIRNRVLFRGFTDDPYRVLRGAEVYVSSSAVEGFGNAIWEALACSLPVVATDCGAPVRALVRHGIDGLLVPDFTVDAFASALRTVMGNARLRQQFGMNASDVITRLPMEAALAAWDRLLDAALTRPEAAVAH